MNSSAVNGLKDQCTFLYSNFDRSIDTARVDDKVSMLSVQIQGVPTSGIIDTDADITIMAI